MYIQLTPFCCLEITFVYFEENHLPEYKVLKAKVKWCEIVRAHLQQRNKLIDKQINTNFMKSFFNFFKPLGRATDIRVT